MNRRIALLAAPAMACAGSIPWTDPGDVGRQYSPAVHEARGPAAEYRNAEASLAVRTLHPDSGTALRLVAAPELSADPRTGTLLIPLLARWRHASLGLDLPVYLWRKGNDGISNRGIGDIQAHAGWSLGDSSLSSEVSALVKMPTGQEAPASGAVLGTGAFAGGIQGILRRRSGSVQLGLGATALLSGEQRIRVEDQSGNRTTRRYDVGDFMSLQVFLRKDLRSGFSCGLDASLANQGRGMVSYGSSARPLAPVTQLTVLPNLAWKATYATWQASASLPAASSLDVPWNPGIRTSVHLDFSLSPAAAQRPPDLPASPSPEKAVPDAAPAPPAGHAVRTDTLPAAQTQAIPSSDPGPAITAATGRPAQEGSVRAQDSALPSAPERTTDSVPLPAPQSVASPPPATPPPEPSSSEPSRPSKEPVPTAAGAPTTP